MNSAFMPVLLVSSEILLVIEALAVFENIRGYSLKKFDCLLYFIFLFVSMFSVSGTMPRR